MIKVIEITVIVSVVTSVATTLLMQILFQKIKNSNNKKLKKQSYQSSPKRIANNEVIKPPNSTVEKQPIANITSPSENSTHIDIKAYHKQQDQKKLCSNHEAPRDRKAQISQQKAISKIVHPPQNIEFTYFAVADGKFVIASRGQASYYRSWKENGQCYYQFFCDESRLNKAINNHSSVIDPFCIKSYDSVDFDVASCIETDECGLLDENNNIKKKTTLNIK